MGINRPEQTGERPSGLVLEGLPPGAGRPSRWGLLIGMAAALAVGTAIGYWVGASQTSSPSPRPVAESSPSSLWPTATPGASFIASPCDLLAGVPFARLPGSFAGIRSSLPGQSPPPGMEDCALLDAQGRRLATLSLRKAPTTANELAVVVDEVFQGDDVAEATIGAQPAFLIPCPHHWPTCHPAVAVVHAPYFLVISLEPGQGEVGVATALAFSLLQLRFP